MEHDLFVDLVQSLREAKEIQRRETVASRRFKVTSIDVKVVREQIGLSESEFACLIRVSLTTLQDWEQHRRKPKGPATALLRILQVAPDVALRALQT